jgi:murein DD-endopeptidase MepM/ murein hydrolase activator NlpD
MKMMMRLGIIGVGVFCAVAIAACQPLQMVSTNFRATLQAGESAAALPTVETVFLPTNTPLEIASSASAAPATPDMLQLATNTPNTASVVTTQPAAAAPTERIVPTFTPVIVGTWTPPPRDPSRTIADHYVMRRPIPDEAINYIARTYPYGSTAGGRLQVHKGVDFENSQGTAVLAAADGVVLYAGDDLLTTFGAYNNYYGNVIVIQHAFTDGSGLPISTLYGHLNRANVAAGQAVAAGDVIGFVGGTGIAMGPHLHFEVRAGDPYSFGATRNPDLWIRPYFGFGTLAGRLTDSAGNLLYNATLIIESEQTTRYAFSYADNSINGDSMFGENWVMGDLPEGYYTVTVSDNGRVRFRETVYVFANQTTWLPVQLAD